MFENVEKNMPNFREKIHAIHGDIMEEGLALFDSDREMLRNTIDIVFHSAASVRFEEPLRYIMITDHTCLLFGLKSVLTNLCITLVV